jgi:hypothetical protein
MLETEWRSGFGPHFAFNESAEDLADALAATPGEIPKCIGPPFGKEKGDLHDLAVVRFGGQARGFEFGGESSRHGNFHRFENPRPEFDLCSKTWLARKQTVGQLPRSPK